MPYDPGISYTGGQLLGQGISQFGQYIDKGMEERRKLQEDAAKAQALYSYAKTYGLVTPDEEMQWTKGSLKDKVGLGEGWATTAALAQAKQLHEEAMQNALEVARIHAAATSAAYPGPMSAEDFQRAQDAAEAAGMTALPTGDRRGVQYVPKPFDVESAKATVIPGEGGLPPERIVVDKYGRVAQRQYFQTPPQPNAAAIFGNLFGTGVGAPAPAPAQGPAPTTIPQGAIDALKADPTKRDQFDQYYGTGSAASILGY